MPRFTDDGDGALGLSWTLTRQVEKDVVGCSMAAGEGSGESRRYRIVGEIVGCEDGVCAAESRPGPALRPRACVLEQKVRRNEKRAKCPMRVGREQGL